MNENISPVHDGNELPSLLPVHEGIGLPHNMVQHSTESRSGHLSTHTRPSRMKFNSCGIRCNEYAFLKPEAVDRYKDLIEDETILDGTIIDIPNSSRDIHDYQVHWETNVSLPVLFNPDDFCITFCKGDITAMEKLKDGRVHYDLRHHERNGIGPHKIRPQTSLLMQCSTSKQSSAYWQSSSTPTNTAGDIICHQTNVSVSNVGMTLEIVAGNEPNDSKEELNNNDSTSDDGSDVGIFNTYLPLNDTDEVVDDS